MTRLVLVFMFMFVLAPAARAEVARVTSGEHAGYSRLLVTSAEPPDGWRLTRTADGYALDAGAGTTGFDLSRAFDRIPRTRITALFADPADGRLRIRIGCACHAIAFLHEGRYLVIDVRDGPAPARSAFEQAADGRRMPPLFADRTATGQGGTARYDWLAEWRGGTGPVAAGGRGRPVAAAPAQDELRSALLAGIARGAAAGVIGMRLPQDAPVAMPSGIALFNGGAPGVALDNDPGDGRSAAVVRPDCPDGARFDIGAWATAEPFLLQFAAHRAALVGEFDLPDPAAVDAAIRFHLHLGFGAEAADIMRAFPDRTGDPLVWSLMAAILDGLAPEAPDTRGWMACDSAAALWATLAQPPEAAGAANRQALRQAFGTLPPHLRVLLAPRLQERALQIGDAELAASVAAAAGRGTQNPVTEASPAILLAAWRDGGNDAIPAALAFVAAAHAAGEPVSAEVPGALLALAQEFGDLPEADALSRAGRLSAALAGDFETAFADPARTAEMPELWQLLVDTADNDTFIGIVASRRGLFPKARPDLAAEIGERLRELRLPELALDWLPARSGEQIGAATAAAALVDLGRGREALALLDGLPAAATAELRARAAELVGEHRLAADAWAAAGDPDRAARSARLAGIPGQPATAWYRLQQDVAGAPRSLTADGAGALQGASALVAASAGLRADIDTLLADTALSMDE